MRKHLHRAALGLTTVALVGGALAAPASAATARAEAATDWLSRPARRGARRQRVQPRRRQRLAVLHRPRTHPRRLLRLRLPRTCGPASRRASSGRSSRRSTTTPGPPSARVYAGAVGKLLTAVRHQRIKPADYGDGTLLTTLEGLVVTSGRQTGRAKDDRTGHRHLQRVRPGVRRDRARGAHGQRVGGRGGPVPAQAAVPRRLLPRDHDRPTPAAPAAPARPAAPASTPPRRSRWRSSTPRHASPPGPGGRAKAACDGRRALARIPAGGQRHVQGRAQQQRDRTGRHRPGRGRQEASAPPAPRPGSATSR